MRILQVNDTNQKYGGAETYFYNLINLLTKKENDVETFGSVTFENKLSFITRFYDPFIYLKISKKIKEFSPDIIHCHNISRTISPSVLHAAKKYKIPVVMTIHDYHLICPKTWFIYKDGETCKYGFGWRCIISNCYTRKRGYRYFLYQWIRILKVYIHRRIIKKNVNFFISPSKKLAEWLKKSLSSTNIIVIPNFLDLDFDYTPIKYTKTILYIGKLSKEKGVEYLIKAMPHVLEKIPDAKLVIVSSGPEEGRLKKLNKDLNLYNSIEFTGWLKQEDIEMYYDKSMIIAIPSIWMDNYPMVTLEAMSYGKPVVATDRGGLSEQVKDGYTGFIVRPGDPIDMADKLVKLLSDFELTKKMSDNARKIALEIYSPENHYTKILSIYRACLNSNEALK